MSGSRSRSKSGDDRGSCWNRALGLLARRGHFEQELRTKLLSRAFDTEEVEQVLSRLRQQGYLDDRARASEYIASRRLRPGLGRLRLRQELRRKGVDESLADDLLSNITDEQEVELGMRLVERWAASHPSSSEALARHLERKGLSLHVILGLLGEFEAPSADREVARTNSGADSNQEILD